MLKLTLGMDEWLYLTVGGQVARVKAVEVKSGNVRVVIDAPKAVRVERAARLRAGDPLLRGEAGPPPGPLLPIYVAPART